MALDNDPTAEAPLESLRRELRPVGLLQTMLVEQIALAMARLRRVDALEDPDDRAWARDHAQAERSFHRSLAEFRRQVRDEAKGAKIATPAAIDAPTPAVAPRLLPRLGPSTLDAILSSLPPGPARVGGAVGARATLSPPSTASTRRSGPAPGRPARRSGRPR